MRIRGRYVSDPWDTLKLVLSAVYENEVFEFLNQLERRYIAQYLQGSISLMWRKKFETAFVSSKNIHQFKKELVGDNLDPENSVSNSSRNA